MPKLLYFTLIALFFLQNSHAQDSGFRIDAGESISINNLRFADMPSYFSSDYFRTEGRRCGFDDAQIARQRSGELTKPDSLRSPGDCTAALTRIMQVYSPTDITYIIPVWFHVIYDSAGTGNISDEAIDSQMQVLNEDFQAIAGTLGAQGTNTRIQFELKGITRTMNDSWFNNGAGFQAALGRDTNRFLNVYSHTAGGFLGYSSYPQFDAGGTQDGIVLLYNTVGGRNNGNGQYDQGRTLVHEAGHYLGLEHTFKNGASCQNTFSTADLIVDTSAEAIPHYGCAARSTCGSPDPIYNYMDYSDDICMTNFTPQQANRSVCSLVNYRPDLARVRMIDSNSKSVIIPFMKMLILDD